VLYRLLEVGGLLDARSELGGILGAALALEPERRLASPDVLVEELVGFLARSGEADPPARARRWVKALFAGHAPAPGPASTPASSPPLPMDDAPARPPSRLHAGNTLPGIRDAIDSIGGGVLDVTLPPIAPRQDRSSEVAEPLDAEDRVLSFTGDVDPTGAASAADLSYADDLEAVFDGGDGLSFTGDLDPEPQAGVEPAPTASDEPAPGGDEVLSFTGELEAASSDDEAPPPSWTAPPRQDSLELRDGVLDDDDQPAEPDAVTSQVSGGAHLFADGRALGPLPLLDMERALAATRDATALVAYSGRQWRPVSGAFGGARRGRRLTVPLVDLGPTLLELATGRVPVRVALFHGFEAAVFELGNARVLGGAVAGAEGLAERLVVEEQLVAGGALPDVPADVPDRDEEVLRQLMLQRRLTAGQVDRIRQRMVRRLLATPFTWSMCDALVAPATRRPTAGTVSGVGLAEGIAYVVRNAMPAERLESLWNEHRSWVVRRVEPAWSERDSLPLLPDEQRFAAALPPAGAVLDVLGSWWDEGRHTASGLLFLCVQLGLVELGGEVDEPSIPS